MSFQQFEALSGVMIPQSYLVILTATGKQGLYRTIGNAPHPTVVSSAKGERLPILQTPDLDAAVGIAGGDLVAAGAKGHAGHAAKRGRKGAVDKLYPRKIHPM